MVVGARGWQTHSVTPGERLTKLDRHGAPLSAYLGVLGMPGATAYRGMTEICQPKKGETVVISAASGAVGSVAGQLAKRAGARVVGIAGGAEKCLWVQDSLGFDDCVDHRALDLRAELAAACPNGIDAYFENVGGAVQAAVFDLLNPFARVAMCGMVSQYNEAEFPPGPNLGFVVGKRVPIQGFIVSDKPEQLAEWRALAAPWVADGSLIYREDVVDGWRTRPTRWPACWAGAISASCWSGSGTIRPEAWSQGLWSALGCYGLHERGGFDRWSNVARADTSRS